MEKLVTLKLTESEVDTLDRLFRGSRDDPRVHGAIGTCFWFHGITPEDEKAAKDAWNSIQTKLGDLK